MLAVSVGLDLLGVWSLPGEAPNPSVTILLAVVAAALLAGWRRLPASWTERLPARLAYVATLLALTLVLVTRSPTFGFFAWCNYLLVLELLRGRARFAGVVAAAAVHMSSYFGGVAILLEASGGVHVVFGLVTAISTLLVMLLARVQDTMEQRAANRTLMIDELARANARLEALVEENEGLHAQLLAQAREAGVMDERQRLAREIHDTLAQGLTGIITQLQAADNDAARPIDRRHHLDNAARLARDSLREARRAVQALGPEALETAHLADAIRQVALDWSTTTGLAAEVATVGTARRLHPEVEGTLLRAAQEALANVAKHADASHVDLTLSYMDDVVTLDVLDDGCGFAPAAVTSGAAGGFGLEAMRQRVSRLAGELTIESEPAGGTTISVNLPAVGMPAVGREVVTQEAVGV